MPTIHTAGPAWVVHEQGDANEFVILTPEGRWVIAFRLNGEMTTAQQRPIVQTIAAAPGLLDAARAALDLLMNPDAEPSDASRVEAQLRTAIAWVEEARKS